MALAPQSRVPVHACGGCTLCCKVMGVEEIGKPGGVWCPQCSVGVGCKIYESRPAACRTFDCAWLYEAALGPQWRPDKARFVMAYELGGKRLVVRTDAQRPEAWKRQPYYGWLKAFAKAAAPRGQYVLVDQSGRAIVVLPDRDVDLGVVAPDESIVTTLWGPKMDAVKVKDRR